MTDIVERLRDFGRIYPEEENTLPGTLFLRAADTITTLRAEVERLKIENIQMQAALGYGILAEDERYIIPSNPYKCGTCDASRHLRAEVERLKGDLAIEEDHGKDCVRNISDLRAEVERLKSDRWLGPHEIIPSDYAHAMDCLRADNERLRAALEWALDNAGTDHPSYPYRVPDDLWARPCLVSGDCGGVAEEHFATALEAVEAALAQEKQG